MARFSVTDAATAGVRLVAREPLAILTWTVAILVFLVLPGGWLLSSLAPGLRDFFSMAQLHEQAGDADFDAVTGPMMRLQGQWMGVNLIFWLGGTVARAILAAAAFRAILEPKNRSFGYLRLGAQEGWLTLLHLVQGVLLYIVCIVAAIVLLIVGGVVFTVGSRTEGGILMAGLATTAAVLAVVVPLIWAILRLSLAAPMTFVERNFRLFESWAVTKGQSLRLLGMTLLLVLIIIAIEIVCGGLIVGGLAVTLGLQGFGAGLESVFHQPPETWLKTLWPVVAVVATLGSLVAAVMTAIISAPWAVAYRDLTQDT